jgi:hypothetical protein
MSFLVWLIRTSGAAERGPSAEHLRHRAACRTASRSLSISAVDGDRRSGCERHASDPTRRPSGQAARLPGIPANEQRDDEVPETSAVNDAAVAAYGLSVQAGNPLSERRLAHMFGRTSRRWTRALDLDAASVEAFELVELRVDGRPRPLRRMTTAGAQLCTATVGSEETRSASQNSLVILNCQRLVLAKVSDFPGQ